MGDFTVRPAAPAEAPAIVALVNSAYRGDSSRAGWTTEADMVGGIRIDEERAVSVLGSPGSVILVHERDGAIVACVHLQRIDDGCYLGLLTTRPALQGLGLGRKMIEAAEAWAVENWQSRYMDMTVIVQRTELLAWYGRRGYSPTGERRPFPYGDERFGIPLRDDLAFSVLRKQLLPAT